MSFSVVMGNINLTRTPKCISSTSSPSLLLWRWLSRFRPLRCQPILRILLIWLPVRYGLYSQEKKEFDGCSLYYLLSRGVVPVAVFALRAIHTAIHVATTPLVVLLPLRSSRSASVVVWRAVVVAATRFRAILLPLGPQLFWQPQCKPG